MEEIWKDIKDYEGLYQVSNLGRVKSLSKTLWNGVGYFESKERILVPGKDKDGYLQVGLYKNKKRKSFKIHRLVGQHFILNEENKPEINHKDGDKQNNNVNNLEWVTSSENSTHAYKAGLLKIKKGKENPLHYRFKGSNNPMFGKTVSEETRMKISESMKRKHAGKKNPFYGKHHTEESRKLISKLTTGANNPKAKKVKCVTTGKIFDCMVDGAEYYKIKNSTDIGACCRGRQKSAGKHPITGEKLIWKYLEDSE